MSDVFFNILTRTSGRPNYFKNCCSSIDLQTYKNFKHIVCTDDEASLEYIESSQRKPILVNKIEKHPLVKNKIMSSPYNLYLNLLYNHVESGFVIFLDDDDEFTNEFSLDSIAKKIMTTPDPSDALIFWQVAFPNGLLIPGDFGSSFLRPRNISGIGFGFHSKYLFAAMWDEFKECDFRVVHKLSLVIPTQLGIKAPLTRIQRSSGMGGFGIQDDLRGV